MRNYQLLHVIIAAPALFFLSYWWYVSFPLWRDFRIVPESARWLVSKKRYKEADVVLQKAAKINKATLPNEWWELLDSEEEGSKRPAKDASFPDLLRTPQLRKRALSVFFLW